MFKKIKSFDAALDKTITKGLTSLEKNIAFKRIMLTVYFISCMISLFMFFTPIGLIMLIGSMSPLNPHVSEGAGMLIVLTALFAASFAIIGTFIFISKAFLYIFSKFM